MIKFGLVLAMCLVGACCEVPTELTTVPADKAAVGYSCCSSNPDVGCMIGGEVRINYKWGFCGKVSCNCNGTITTETCRLIAIPINCSIIRDPCQPYPGCCPRIVCPIKADGD